jgi:uncharacterized protein YxeA
MKRTLVGIAVAVILVMSLGLVSSAEAGRVSGYFRKDNTYVQPYYRSNPDRSPYNNYGYPGNYNPNTGKQSTGNPDAYLKRYNNRKNNSYTPYEYHETTEKRYQHN